jgi:hypothetical protein
VTENKQNESNMKQIEATPQRPFFSVGYEYERNPWTLFSCNKFSGTKGQTMQGTHDFEQAKATADSLVTEPGIIYAVVSKSEGCCNHSTVYEARAIKPEASEVQS